MVFCSRCPTYRLSTAALALALSTACVRPDPAGSSTAPQATEPAELPDTEDLLGRLPAPVPLEGGGWSRYLGTNQVRGLAFGGSESLWAATEGGLVHWDLASGEQRQYTTASGLPSNRLTSVALAPAPGEGGPLTVWVGTGAGVAFARDGGWTVMTQADGLPADAVLDLAVTPGGEVWIATTEGAGCFDGRAWTVHRPGQIVWDLDVGPDGDLWLAMGGLGAGHYAPQDGTWTIHGTEQGLPGYGVTAVAADASGGAWAYVNWEGVWRLEGAAGDRTVCWRRAYDTPGLTCALDVALERAGRSDGGLWVGTCGGMHSRWGELVHHQEEGWTVLEGWHELGNPAIEAIATAPGPDGAVAVATELGIALRRDDGWQTLRAGPARNRVTAAAVTPDGAAWFGFGDDAFDAAGGGVSHLRADGGWDYSLGDANVRVLRVAPDGTLWAGAGCSLWRYAGEGWREVAGCDRLGSIVIDISFEAGGAAWIATHFGVYRFDGQDWQAWTDLMPIALAAAGDDNAWVSQTSLAPSGCGLWFYDGERWSPLPGEPHCPVQMAVDGQGALWIPSPSSLGLDRYAGGAWRRYPAPQGLRSGGISQLVAAPQGGLWLVAGGNIVRFDGEDWQAYGLPAAGVHALAVAPDGSLWVGTAEGVAHLVPEPGPPSP
jgi:hypothetical protein